VDHVDVSAAVREEEYMAASVGELWRWSERRWTAVQDALSRAVTRTAKCRQALPTGPNNIGQSVLVVPNIVATVAPIIFGADTLITAVHLNADLVIDGFHVDDDSALILAIGSAAAQLGGLEDVEVIHGGALPNPARVPRHVGAVRTQLNVIGAGGSTVIGAGAGVAPTGPQLLTAITTGMASLETAGRPGSCGLLLNNSLLATLGLPPIAVAGAAPFIRSVEQIIGSLQIAGTTALVGAPFVGGQVAGILFRLEPAAVDLVHTMLPTLTFTGRVGGLTTFRVEEEIAVRILDQAGVHHIVY
jgi:hypothetical protein